MVSLNKRTSMALFSDPSDHYCQRVRIVLEEKGISSEIIDTDKNNINAEILEVSPYSTLPVLVDRDVCLYDSVTLMEYLDERFPHPPLLPVYPAKVDHPIPIIMITHDVINAGLAYFKKSIFVSPTNANIFGCDLSHFLSTNISKTSHRCQVGFMYLESTSSSFNTNNSTLFFSHHHFHVFKQYSS
mgnify:CR=1 FL=1